MPTRNISFDEVTGVPNWKDMTPRLGVAYDLFGTGKTAVKFSIGKYLEAPNPPTFTRVGQSGRRPRAERDADLDRRNNDFVPQADELGPLNPSNFGTDHHQHAVRRRCADEPRLQLGARRAGAARDRARACR